MPERGPGLAGATHHADDPGLGLAVAAMIAEAHGGRLTALRPPEGGARFELSLPAVD